MNIKSLNYEVDNILVSDQLTLQPLSDRCTVTLAGVTWIYRLHHQTYNRYSPWCLSKQTQWLHCYGIPYIVILYVSHKHKWCTYDNRALTRAKDMNLATIIDKHCQRSKFVWTYNIIQYNALHCLAAGAQIEWVSVCFAW